MAAKIRLLLATIFSFIYMLWMIRIEEYTAAAVTLLSLTLIELWSQHKEEE